MDGVTLTPLKQIYNPKGDVFHAMKESSTGFSGFGEAYFSTISAGEVKGWKKHKKMTLNLVVPVGEIRFVVSDGEHCFSVTLSQKNYQRLTVSPGLFMAFKGVSEGQNLLLNISDIEHDPDEVLNIDLNEISYDWE